MPTGDWRVTMKVVESSSGRLFDSTFAVREDQSVEGPGTLSAATVAADVASWLGTLWRAMFSSALVLESVAVRELGTEEPTAAEALVNGPGTGSAPANVNPYALCAVTVLHTDLATRSGRGWFHNPWCQSQSALNTPAAFLASSPYIVAAIAVKDALLAGHDATHDIVVHHYSTRVWSKRLGQSHDVKSAKVNLEPKWLRSRMSAP